MASRLQINRDETLKASTTPELRDQIKLLRSGDRKTLARLLTAAENDAPFVSMVLESCRNVKRFAHTIGITGAPGVGKSSLVAALVEQYRSLAKRVAVLAIDPSSPFSGGALLGDRVRMTRGSDDGVFYRSVASRDGSGGITHNIGRLLRLIDLASYDVVLLETVGAGQSEVAVAQFAQTVAVVLAPGLGDDVQMNKAGILEIGDAFAVNKADLSGADKVKRELRAMIKTTRSDADWKPPVVATSAPNAEGVTDLVEALDQHRVFLEQKGLKSRPRRQWVEAQVSQALASLLLASIRREAPAWWTEAIEAVLEQRLDPLTAAEELLDHVAPNAQGNLKSARRHGATEGSSGND